MALWNHTESSHWFAASLCPASFFQTLATHLSLPEQSL